MSPPLLRHTWRSQRTKLLIVMMGLAIWGFLMPIIYATVGKDLEALISSNPLFRQMSQFGGADVFSLGGAIALGFVHPIAVALIGVFAVGMGSSAVAGERQRGTLEVLLARPVSRNGMYLTLLLAVGLFIALAVAALLAGSLVGALAWDVLGEIDVARVPILFLNGWLLWFAFAALALAASVSFDRLAPALGITLGVVIISYFLDVLGSLWPDAAWLQPYSLFHYLRPKPVLTGTFPTLDLALLSVVAVIGIAYALWIFPRRDIAAPS
jgi:ABC-2 type transport system permease protein